MLGRLGVPPAVHVAPEPVVVGHHQLGRVDPADPGRQRVEALARDALHRAAGRVDDHHRRDALAAPADGRPPQRDEVVRVALRVELQRRLEQQLAAVAQPDVAQQVVVEQRRGDVAQRRALAQLGRRVGVLGVDDHHARRGRAARATAARPGSRAARPRPACRRPTARCTSRPGSRRRVGRRLSRRRRRPTPRAPPARGAGRPPARRPARSSRRPGRAARPRRPPARPAGPARTSPTAPTAASSGHSGVRRSETMRRETTMVRAAPAALMQDVGHQR